jgi:hypothetical protein
LAKLHRAQTGGFYLDGRRQILVITVLSSRWLGINAEILLTVLMD